ncbi:hypothetical protein X766_15995 [Mesorhizobium sp. LSJC255A00]|uniref:hypothetical protein n=1 Tax=Mesorhizobium sp. LSJC255A00 TaxID=1287313 RepID=UPI0003CF5535|nr:hypothetical protein [Mesorhizobium sp. LSJC255A00]ESX17892.1 hypothetical protein X766_15995 [Mesorhizobium sp. LSJC255A00]
MPILSKSELKELIEAQYTPSEAAIITSEILARIQNDPALAHEIGTLLIECAMRDVAEALTSTHKD